MSEQIDLTPYVGLESPPVEFPGGLIGFPEWTRFTLVDHPEGGPLRLLQSLDNDRVSFLVANPAQIMSGYQIAVAEVDARAIGYPGAFKMGGDWPPDLWVYCILTVQEEPFHVTANLLGPLVINSQAGLGRQLVLADSGYDSRYPVTGGASRTPASGQAGGSRGGGNGGARC